jgi:hypothetical protein
MYGQERAAVWKGGNFDLKLYSYGDGDLDRDFLGKDSADRLLALISRRKYPGD